MKTFTKSLLAMAMALGFGATAATAASGWPAQFEGVMLQGFYWDSQSATKWTVLESQADELSQYFKLIWVPNSGKSASGGYSMGYDPVYWFTNHNSAFGTEAEIRSLIKTFKAKGTGIIEDVVINHRSGKSNWTDFPEETWNGTTWKIGLDGICCTDEVNKESGQAHGTGAADTGEDFNGSRDLDHTNANVQNNCKNYCKFLLEDMGYAGFRLDMVKGYGGQYTKIYNQYSNPTYCVGEYWDGNYDAVAAWIEATGRTSAAFDFPGKYAINEAFASNDMTKLVWNANGTTPQPAGMIHFGYPRYAVTFIDNHDTGRDDWNKFSSSKVTAAYAFLLCSPGTPCVFWPHWTAYKAELKKLITARNSVGVNNESAVRVLRTDASCYMAEVTGTKGKLVVKVGSAMASPDGYSDSQIVASGTDYCVWTTNSGGTGGGGGTTPTDPTQTVTVYFDNSAAGWTTPHIHYWGISESTWPGVAMSKASGNIWTYTCPAGTTGILFNAGDGDATKTSDFKAVDGHIYNQSGDQGAYSGGGGGGGTDPVTPGDVTVYFDNSTAGWATPHIYYWGTSKSTWPGVAMSKASGNIWTYTCPAGTTGILFNAGDGDATKTSDFKAVDGHIYNQSGDQGAYSGGGGGGGGGTGPVTPGTYPAHLYLIGDVCGWNTATSIEADSQTDGEYTWNSVNMPAAEENTKSYFSFVTVQGADWDAVNDSDRYGSGAEPNGNVAITDEAPIVLYPVNVSAIGATAWEIEPGSYKVVANLKTMKLKVSGPDSSLSIGTSDAADDAIEYFNLQGVRVSNPTGLVIVKQGSRVSKQLMR